MEIYEIVEKINNGETVGDVAKFLKMSRNTLSRKLKAAGYKYDYKISGYKLREDGSENNNNKVVENHEKGTNELLTKGEIQFVKDSYKRLALFDKDFELNYEKNNLPPRKPEKRTNYIVSEKTYEEFETFAREVGEPIRMTRNDMVEMALRKFMRDFE